MNLFEEEPDLFKRAGCDSHAHSSIFPCVNGFLTSDYLRQARGAATFRETLAEWSYDYSRTAEPQNSDSAPRGPVDLGELPVIEIREIE